MRALLPALVLSSTLLFAFGCTNTATLTEQIRQSTDRARTLEGVEKAEFAGPYVATPWIIVDEMLTLARVGANDFVVDLGSGDGRILIQAATRYGARGGFGVDIDGDLVTLANQRAAAAGVGDRVRFYQRDLYVTDVHEASVVTIYLLPAAMPRLVTKLLAELAPGTRVVSHDYPLTPWPEDKVVHFDVDEKVPISGTTRTALWLYTVPARVAGEWELLLPQSVSPVPRRVAIAQQAEGTAGSLLTASGDAAGFPITVRGDRITLALPPLSRHVILEGRATGDMIEGNVDVSGVATPWRAKRIRATGRVVQN